MNWFKISFLLCNCVSVGFANEAVSEISRCSVVSQKSKEENASTGNNLIQRNPFIPFKLGKSISDHIDTNSDFVFLSVVVYPDHQEFSLKEKTKEKPFWLSSDNRIQDKTYGLVFRNYYPGDKTLVVQDSFSSDLINLRQERINLKNETTSSSFGYFRDNDWSLLLSDDDDSDDELPKKSTGVKK